MLKVSASLQFYIALPPGPRCLETRSQASTTVSESPEVHQKQPESHLSPHFWEGSCQPATSPWGEPCAGSPILLLSWERLPDSVLFPNQSRNPNSPLLTSKLAKVTLQEESLNWRNYKRRTVHSPKPQGLFNCFCPSETAEWMGCPGRPGRWETH